MSDAASVIDKALSRFSNPADFCRSLTITYLAMGEADRSQMVLALIAEIAAREVSARALIPVDSAALHQGLPT